MWETPLFSSRFHRVSLSRLSYALRTSTKAAYRLVRRSLVEVNNVWMMKMLSSVLYPSRPPDLEGGSRSFISEKLVNLDDMIRAKIFPMQQIIDICL